MLKKIIALLLCFSMCIAFASCKKEEKEGEEYVIQNGEIVTADSNAESGENADNNGGSQGNSSPTESEAAKTVKVTIPEGYTLVRISWLLEEKGLCTSDEFIKAAQSYRDWLNVADYPFLESLAGAQNVCFYLEGYFFPLTYNIPENSTAKDIIKIFLNGTKSVFNSSLLSRVQASGYNLHQILTLASIVEKEAFLNDQRPMVSSVLHNRLKQGMKLQCDPTVKYCTGVIEHIYPDQIDRFKYYYNTYRCDGLMAGPICNPGMASIEAALTPANNDYTYFVIGTVEPYEAYYFTSYEEHSKFWAENKDRLTGATVAQ